MEAYQIDERSNLPIWLQLRNRLIYLISSGHYKPGDKLPTVRDMAISLKINYNTVNKVYQSLLHDGYLLSYRGRGTFVCDIARPDVPKQDSPADSIIDLMIDRCLEIGVPLGDIASQVVKRVERYRSTQDDAKTETQQSGMFVDGEGD